MDLLDRRFPWPSGGLSSILVKGPQPGIVFEQVSASQDAVMDRVVKLVAKARRLGFTEDMGLPNILEVPSEDTPAHLMVLGTKDIDDDRALACCVVVTPVDDPCRGACVPLVVTEDRTRILSAPGPWFGAATDDPGSWGEGLSAFDYGQEPGDGLPSAATYIASTQDAASLGCDGWEREVLADAAELARLPGALDSSGAAPVAFEASRARVSAMARLWSVLDAMIGELHTPAPPDDLPWGPQTYLAELPGSVREALLWATLARWCFDTECPMRANTMAEVCAGRVADLSEGATGDTVSWWDLLTLAVRLTELAGRR